MKLRMKALFFFGIAAVAMFGSPIAAQEKKIVGSPAPGVKERMAAIEHLFQSRTDESITKFMNQHLAPALRSSKTSDEWHTEIKHMRQLYSDFGTVRLSKSASGGLAVTFGGCPGADTPLLVDVDPAPPHLITALRTGERQSAAAKKPVPPKIELTWDNLQEKLKEAESAGLSGAILVIRNGNIFLREGYGYADRSRNIPNKPDTMFAIGSTPIDFTQGAILKLEDMGKLRTSDPINKYLPNVPEDKKAITIDQLMTGRSGLPNFHGRPNDPDPDNSWIDRDEALRRILGSELLFPPGTDRAHSHSAFGLLAAIVEIVSGDTYMGFLRKNMFDPSSMNWTHHYEDVHAGDEQVAIGYGGRDAASVNSPKNWGKTSWLVLGSGGMVSTVGDLHRWNQAVRDGKLLSSASTEKYWKVGGGVFVGGNMHGFYTSYTTGPNSMFFLCTNDIAQSDRSEKLTDALVSLVNKPK